MDRSRIGRAVAILAIAALAVAVVSPAFSAAPVTKAKVKKLAKKAVKQNIDDFGNPIFIEEAELVRFGPVMLNVPGTAAIGTFGPFTLTASCQDDGGGNIKVLVLITTSEDNSTYESNDDNEDDFDVADNPNPEWWAEDTGGIIVAGPQQTNSEEDEGHASSPSGTNIDGRTTINTNFGGFDCSIAGYVIVESPA